MQLSLFLTQFFSVICDSMLYQSNSCNDILDNLTVYAVKNYIVVCMSALFYQWYFFTEHCSRPFYGKLVSFMVFYDCCFT